MSQTISIDFDLVMKLRLVVARFGELDGHKWWTTDGLLGSLGKTGFRRNFPKTHRFAQAKVVFEVARLRCRERFEKDGTMTLWDLPMGLDDQFDAHWTEFLKNRDSWEEFFVSIEKLPDDDLLKWLSALNLLSPEAEGKVSKLKRSHEDRAVLISGISECNDEAITLLAAAFSRGKPGDLAIPYATVGS